MTIEELLDEDVFWEADVFVSHSDEVRQSPGQGPVAKKWWKAVVAGIACSSFFILQPGDVQSRVLFRAEGINLSGARSVAPPEVETLEASDLHGRPPDLKKLGRVIGRLKPVSSFDDYA